ncbi:unnamed protein product [Cylindrotheca closterium]|uniref:Uncharacterized protein n=1 Tax=Cylindrotheca closterium TaxID=2856 RepID=A0AAD2FQE3_9STRA|nr:unnamed protein product [Cylindrotheca closterium]
MSSSRRNSGGFRLQSMIQALNKDSEEGRQTAGKRVEFDTKTSSSRPEKRPKEIESTNLSPQESRAEGAIESKRLSSSGKYQHFDQVDRNLVSDSRKMERLPVFLNEFPQGKSLADTVAFLNQVMRDEGLVDKHTPKAIISYRSGDPSGYCVLDMATAECQKKICWLNAIPWSNSGIIKIGRNWTGCIKPQFDSWAIYRAQGDATRVRLFLRDPPTKAKNEILSFFNAKLSEYGLTRRGEFGVLRYRYEGAGPNLVGVLEVANAEVRDKIFCLNGVGGWRKDPSYRFNLFPHKRYTGPPPKYQCFGDFLKDYESRAGRLDGQFYEPPASNPTQSYKSNEYHEYTDRSSDNFVYGSNHRRCADRSDGHYHRNDNRDWNNSDRVHQAPGPQPNCRFASNEHDDGQIQISSEEMEGSTYSNLNHSVQNYEHYGNDRRSYDGQNRPLSFNANDRLPLDEHNENDELKKKIAELQESNNSLTQNLSEKTQAANYFQSMLTIVKNDLSETQGQLNSVHASWQEQTIEIESKDAQIAELQGCINELNAKVGERKRALSAQSQALLDEAMRRQAASAILDQYQIDNMKQQARLDAAIAALKSTGPKKEEQNDSGHSSGSV